ncbi:glycosyltransferase [Thermophilibacter sp.]
MSFTSADHTFVVCAYQENPYIGTTIESLQAQTVRSNIILSTSTPSAYLDDVCSRYDIPMVVNTHPYLAGDDWNYGYDQAQTRLVTMAHQDDYYAPQYVERVLAALGEYGEGEVLIAFTDYFEMRNGEDVHNNRLLKIKRVMNAPLRSRALNKSRFVKRRILAFGDSICCPAVTLVKQNLGSSPFDTTYKNSCDYKTWVDLAGKPGRFVYVPEQLMGHRIYAESATSRNLGENIRKSEDEEIMATLWPRPVARIINRAYAMSEKSNEL